MIEKLRNNNAIRVIVVAACFAAASWLVPSYPIIGSLALLLGAVVAFAMFPMRRMKSKQGEDYPTILIPILLSVFIAAVAGVISGMPGNYGATIGETLGSLAVVAGSLMVGMIIGHLSCQEPTKE